MDKATCLFLLYRLVVRQDVMAADTLGITLSEHDLKELYQQIKLFVIRDLEKDKSKIQRLNIGV